jgi:hypothetical protein
MATGAPLMPHEYFYVWQLLREPLTAGELDHVQITRPTAKAAQLRPLVKRGWITKDDSGIYRATERARQAVWW